MNPKTRLFATCAALALAPALAVAQTAAPGSPPAANDPAPELTPAQRAAAERAAPETIVVTATRRDETAIRVPFNISVTTGEQLREANITELKSLIQDNVAISAPQNSARFADSVTVRGLNVSRVDANNLEYFVRSTLSYYMDETPLPNIGFRIKDIARTESLIGPQGTLYGAGALGGVIRYITNAPKLGAFEGRANASLWQIQGGGLSNEVDFTLNVPLGDTFALRGVYYRLDDAGFTDRISNPPWLDGARALVPSPDPARNLYKNDDYEETDGYRISALWQPTERMRLRYTYASQDQLAHGTSGASILPLRVANATTEADRALWLTRPGEEFRGAPSPALACGTACRFDDPRATPYAVNDQTIVSPYEEFADRDLSMHTFEFGYDFSFARLQSSTARYEDVKVGQADYFSQGFIFYCDISFDDIGGCLNSTVPGVRHALVGFDNRSEGIVHETRLVSTGDGPINWLVGVFHNETKSTYAFTEVIPDPDGAGPGLGLDAFSVRRFGGKVLPSPNPDEGYFESFTSDYTETAIFGEIGWRITPKWRAAASARVFNYEDQSERTLFDYAGAFISETIRNTIKDEAVSYYRFNTAYDLTDTLLVYFTASQGFRRGGANPFRDLNTTTRVVNPEIRTYRPDSTDNFELGLKGTLFDRRLTIETNVYQINWKDAQTYYTQSISGFPVNGTVNGPDAVSRGIEFSSRFRLNDNWSFSYKTAYGEAEWDETLSVCTYTAGIAAGGCPGPGTTRTGRTWAKGGALGGTPKGRHDFGVRYRNTLSDGSRIFASLSGTRRGETQSDRCDDDGCNGTIYVYPAYVRINGSMGWSNDDWNVSAWVENLTDERAPVSNNPGGILGNRIITLTPITFGMNFGRTF